MSANPGPDVDGDGESERDTISLKDLGISWVKELEPFAKNPLRFLRKKLIPIALGAILGITETLAQSVAAPFEAIQTGLATLAAALGRLFSGYEVSGSSGDLLSFATSDGQFYPVGSIAWLIATPISIIQGLVGAITAPLGPLQPFGVAVIYLALGWLAVVVLIRLFRAGLQTVPGLGGLETLIFE